MVGRRRLPPVAAAALGAAWTFYGYRILAPAGVSAAARFLTLSLLGAAAVLAVLWALGREPIAGLWSVARARRGLPWSAAAFALGTAIGVAALGSDRSAPAWGVPVAAVSGISGTVLDDPRIFDDRRGMLRVGLRNVRAADGARVSAGGEVTVFLPAAAVPGVVLNGRGSAISAAGRVLPAKGGFAAAFRAESAEVTAKAPPPQRLRTGWRSSLLERLAPLDWGGLALALLFGVRDQLDTDIAQAYTRAGSAHVLALSGMHLAVISALVAMALKKPLGLRAAAVAGAVCIVAYVAFVGSQPSLVRSVLMYVFGAAAILAGRPRRGAALLGAAFLVQLGLDPASALSLSFVLSYLALAGILWIGAAADELQDGLVPAFVRTPLAASIGAFTLTAPVVVAFFGSLRPIGIPAALLLVPLASLFMVLALAYLVLAAAVPFAAHPLALVLSALYRVNNRIVRFAAEAPEWPLDNTVLALILSLAVSVLLLYLRQRINHTRMRLDPFD